MVGMKWLPLLQKDWFWMVRDEEEEVGCALALLVPVTSGGIFGKLRKKCQIYLKRKKKFKTFGIYQTFVHVLAIF